MRYSSRREAVTDMRSESKQNLNPDEILIAEFNYIANSAFQANEDRSRAMSFYFVSVGSLMAEILGTQFATNEIKNVSLAVFVPFAALTGLGGLISLGALQW
jgi:hypothetical protein